MTGVFDLDEALERVDGDRDFLAELAQTYLDEVADLLPAMADAMKKLDIVAATKKAHTLKGASANFCAPALHDAAWGFEQMLPSNSTEEILFAYERLVRESIRLNEAMRQEFSL